MRQIGNQAAALAALAVLASCSNDDSRTRTEPSATGAGSNSTLLPKTGRGILTTSAHRCGLRRSTQHLG